jgi:rubredoxin
MLPQGVCPACELHVQFSAVATASGRVYRCNNCWHVLNDAELKNAQSISDKLAELERQRLAIIGGGNANSAKNR